MPGTVVLHHQDDRRSRRAVGRAGRWRRQGRRRCRARCAPWPWLTGRVVEQVAHHARELLPTATHPPGRHRAALDRRCRSAGRAPPRRARRRRGRSSGVGELGLLAAGQLEQVADDLLHAVVLGEHPPDHDRPVGGVGVRERDLARGAHRGDRRPQLVRRVRHELALSVRRVLRAGRASRSSCGPAGRPRPSRAARDTRWSRLAWLIAVTSARIVSTGRSARPVTPHAISADHDDQDRAPPTTAWS